MVNSINPGNRIRAFKAAEAHGTPIAVHGFREDFPNMLPLFNIMIIIILYQMFDVWVSLKRANTESKKGRSAEGRSTVDRFGRRCSGDRPTMLVLLHVLVLATVTQLQDSARPFRDHGPCARPGNFRTKGYVCTGKAL